MEPPSTVPRPAGLRVSIVTPAFNEARNLPELHRQLVRELATLPGTWEWIIVDDRSRDDTFATVTELARQDPRIRGVRFSRNFGSHMAMICGLEHARGDCAVVLAADCQDPPEVIPQLVEQWRAGVSIVFAVRETREGHTGFAALFSRFYYFLMRDVIGLKDIPPTGADFFLLDRKVIRELVRLREVNLSILPLIVWMGFRQSSLGYTKRARVHGTSGWNLAKKVKVVIDSVAAFSYLPIRVMSVTGFAVAAVGFLYAALVVYNALRGNPPQGWASTVVIVLVLGGVQMMMIGVLGEYLWRALDETRSRPRYIVEDRVGDEPLQEDGARTPDSSRNPSSHAL
ncbi:MAG TPA: glycosyltransferase [Verrucomicrobiales bacterium]|nr:glycosyltransferase [Verrucomicrobiales bacterium]